MENKPRRRTEPASSSLHERSTHRNSSQKENQPLALPRINHPNPTKSDRNVIVLNEFVHKYFRRKSESSCLQLINTSVQQIQQTTSMHTEAEQIQKGSCAKEHAAHGMQLQRQKRYRSQRKSHLRSFNDGLLLLQQPQQMLVSRTRIDQYFHIE